MPLWCASWRNLIPSPTSSPGLLQEFDLEIMDKVKLENVVADHLSRLGPKATPSKDIPIDDSFPDDKLLPISHHATPWYADMGPVLFWFM